MVVNTAGFVPVKDRGAPKIVSAKCREDVTAGQFLMASGANNVVSSGANSFATTDIEVATGASGAAFTGIAIADATSGNLVGVLQEGGLIVTADGTVTAGTQVLVGGNDSVATGATAGQVIGRALTSAASGGHAIVDFNA